MYNPITVNDAFIQLSNDIKSVYPINEAIRISNYIFEDLFGITDLRSAKLLDEVQYNKLKEATVRLLKNEPVQYITNRADFMGLHFYVDHNVLIPRPETEELVDLINKDNPKNKALKLLDIGTGSGCIAIALAKNSKQWNVTAWDISDGALEVAKRNAEKLNVQIEFKLQDALNYNANEEEKYDIIVSNPPYIGVNELNDMDETVVKHEPKEALFAGDDPLVFYKLIANLGSKMLNPKGNLYFELNPKYALDIIEIVKSHGYREVEVFKDLEGKNRMLKAVVDV